MSEYRKYKATFHTSTSASATPGAPPAAPTLRSQRRPLDGGGWPCGLALGDGQPARLGLLGLGGWGCSGGTAASGSVGVGSPFLPRTPQSGRVGTYYQQGSVIEGLSSWCLP